MHIFEPRYKEMIGECRANSMPFGVIRAMEEGIARDWMHRRNCYRHERVSRWALDLVAEGRERFEVLELNRSARFCARKYCRFPMSRTVPAEAEKLAQSKLTGKS